MHRPIGRYRVSKTQEITNSPKHDTPFAVFISGALFVLKWVTVSRTVVRVIGLVVAAAYYQPASFVM